MNLDNLNLVELNAQEVQCVNGGEETSKSGFFGTLGNLMDAAVQIGSGIVHGAANAYASYVTAYPYRP